MSAHRLILKYNGKEANPLQKLAEKHQREVAAAEGDPDLQKNLSYKTSEKFFENLTQVNKPKDRASIIYRDYCFTNNLTSMDKDPLCMPIDPAVITHPKVVKLLNSINGQPQPVPENKATKSKSTSL